MGQRERVANTGMTKKEVQIRVLQDGKKLALSKFKWDEDTNTFSTAESDIAIKLPDASGCTFNTGDGCTFDTSWGCTFKTGPRCAFDTGSRCTFNTGYDCTFDTGPHCTFDTGYGCTFDTGHDCTFKTGVDCTFDTGGTCTFLTGDGCTFDTGGTCTFITGDGCTFVGVGDCTFSTGSDCIWVIDNKSYPFAPLFIQGSKWPVNVYRPGYLKIGCKAYSFSVWGGYAEKVAKEEGATKEVLEEYLGLIEVAKAWAKEKGWLTPG